MRQNSGQLAIPLALCLFVAACAQDHGASKTSIAAPYKASWVKRQIAAFETKQGAQSSAVTKKVVYKGKPAFFIPSPCCDLFNYIYDEEGDPLCAPSGGFTGRGDGTCPRALSEQS